MAKDLPYWRGDKSAVPKVRMLSAIAHGEGTKKEPSARTGLRPASAPTSALAVECQRLMHDPAFPDKDNPKHKDVMVRYIALTAQMYPEPGWWAATSR